MSWVTLNSSKNEVRRAGDFLISEWGKFEEQKYIESYEILVNWRSSHAYPMQSMIAHFRNKSFEIDKHAVIVQRLKRLPSILTKLTRENGMRLDRIEDIAGCRIVVENIRNVHNVRDNIVNSRTGNILRRERDYIRSPKDSGYRGIHLIYKYNGQKFKFSGHCVELQIRSKVQHSWATAVEVVGTFTNQALKASQGTDDWLRFFKVASIAFTDLEYGKTRKNRDTKERAELRNYAKLLSVLERLQLFSVTTQHLGLNSNIKGDYFLLMLDTALSKITFSRYPQTGLVAANERYAELEQEYKDDPTKDVVLVSATSIHDLKKAYPNYFSDTTNFSRYLSKVLSTT